MKTSQIKINRLYRTCENVRYKVLRIVNRDDKPWVEFRDSQQRTRSMSLELFAGIAIERVGDTSIAGALVKHPRGRFTYRKGRA